MRGDTQDGRKTYTPPKMKKLNKDEARLLLEDRANRGDKGAVELLKLLNKESDQDQNSVTRKKAG